MDCDHQYKHFIQDRTVSVCSNCEYTKAEQDADALGALLIKTKAKLAAAEKRIQELENQKGELDGPRQNTPA